MEENLDAIDERRKEVFELEFQAQEQKEDEERLERIRRRWIVACCVFAIAGSFIGLVLTILANTTTSSNLPLPQMTPFDMQQYDELYLWHVRKAGGTTLRKFLEEVAKKY